MDDFAEVFHQNPLAAAFGAMGLLCQLTWPLFRSQKAIVTVQAGIGAVYGAQYALPGAWSGAGVAALGATQSSIAFLAGERSWLRRLSHIFPLIAAVICPGDLEGGGLHLRLRCCVARHDRASSARHATLANPSSGRSTLRDRLRHYRRRITCACRSRRYQPRQTPSKAETN